MKTLITNLTTNFPFHIESVDFEPATADLLPNSMTPNTPSLTQSQVISPSSSSASSDALSILDLSNTTVLRPGCSTQFVFEIKYRNPESVDPKTITSLGSAVARWRFPMGEACTANSSPVFVNLSSKKPFSFIVSTVPSSVKLNQAFNVSFLVRNISTAPIRPRLVAVKSKMEGIIPMGLTGILGPKLEPNESYTFNLKAIALETGLQTLQGLRMTELEKDKIYDLNNVLTLSVEL